MPRTRMGVVNLFYEKRFSLVERWFTKKSGCYSDSRQSTKLSNVLYKYKSTVLTLEFRFIS